MRAKRIELKKECVVRISSKREWRAGAVLLAALACLTWSAPALAQDGAPADGGQPAEEGAVDPIPSDMDRDDPRFWAEVRGIETVHPRSILKEGRFGLTGYVGTIPNNIFAQYWPVGVRLNYFVLENIGLELSGNYACGFGRDQEEKDTGFRKCGRDTGLRSTLTDGQGISATSVLLGDEQLAHVNFGVNWSPVFGKTAWRNKALKYFDFYLFGGVGWVLTQTQPDIGQAPQLDFNNVEGVIGGGLMYFLQEKIALRVDYRQFIFQKQTGGVSNPSEISLGVMWMPKFGQ